MRTLAPTLVALCLAACGPAHVAGTGGSGGDGGGGGTGGEAGTGGTGGEREAPRIDELQPDHGKPGDAVILVGVHFDPDAQGNAVRFGELDAAVVSLGASGTELTVTVPAGAVTDPVHLTAFGVTTDGPVFTVEDRNPQPRIGSADPRVFAAGDSNKSFTVTGSGIYESTTASIDGTTVQSALQQPGTLVVRMPDNLLAETGGHTLLLHNPAPGGGDSNAFTLTVAAPLRLVGAAFASSTTLALQFDQDVNADEGQLGIYYSVTPSLLVKMGIVSADIPRMVLLQTAAAPADTTFTITVDRKLRAASGVPLGVQNTLTFRSFDGLPDPTGTFHPPADCSAAGIMGPAGLWGGAHLLVTESTGNQIQQVGLDGSNLSFLGNDGTTIGLHASGSALGCPGGDSSEDGALFAPVGAAVEEASGAVVVGDTGHGSVLRYKRSGGSEVMADGLTYPALLGIFGADAYVAEPGRILRVSVDGSHEPLPLAAPGTLDFQFAFKTDAGGIPGVSVNLATPAGNRSYILVDPGNHRLQRSENLAVGTGWLGVGHEDGFAKGGACCSEGTAPGQFTDPRGVVVLASGALYAIDAAGGGRLQKFDADGKPLRQETLNFLPSGIALTADGTMWIAGSDGSLHRYVP